MAMRELRVEDALLYLDQVKLEFGDRPHIYNEFLDIMKTFKTQQLDTPGVIRRVSNLFKGNRRLVLGFNTFLPEGYKIELPADGDGPPVAVFRAPGSTARYVLNDGPAPGASTMPLPPLQQQQPQQQQQQGPVSLQSTTVTGGQLPSHLHSHTGQQPQQQPFAPKRKFAGGIQDGAIQPKRVKEEFEHQPQSLSVSTLPQGSNAVSNLQSQQILPQPSQSSVQQRAIDTSRPFGARDVKPQKSKAPSKVPPLGNVPVQGSPLNLPAPVVPPQQQQQLQEAQQQAGEAVAPLEFDHAINYVTTIKRRFASEPETYKKFLEILHTYQKEQRGIKEVLDDVSALFADHPDLLKEFTFFLPDAVQAQAKAQLDAVAKEAENRKRTQAQKAILQQAQGMQRQAAAAAAAAAQPAQPRVPAAAAAPSATAATARPADADARKTPTPRAPERETQLAMTPNYGTVSISPSRPPRVGELTPLQASAKNGRPTMIAETRRIPTVAERHLFEKVKQHLTRKELMSDNKMTRRHTPHSEFLKCLHLFAAGILAKDELLMLLRGLFMQGHAPKSGANAGGGHSSMEIATDATELLRDFEEIFVGRGPYADQEMHMKMKSKYGSLTTRDFDFSHCARPTPSYRMIPTDYPKSLFNSHSGQTERDAGYLNKTLVSVGVEVGKRNTVSIEQYDGVRKRHNPFEEAMFRMEDERFEVDMAIERNAQTMRTLEPYAEEALKLKDQEEKDGQPIGRLRYQLFRNSMNSIHINAIGRVYGDRGDEVIQHLLRNQLVVLPIVYQRLKQKDSEWRKLKAEMNERWNSIAEANYEGSKDTTCYFYRREMEQSFSRNHLLEECKNAKQYVNSEVKVNNHPAVKSYVPKFLLQSDDEGACLYQPHISVKCAGSRCHKDAFNLLSSHINTTSVASELDKDRVSRIWAEFVFPFFGYPVEWYNTESVQNRIGQVGQSFVKFSTGQDVMTIYGEGNVISFMPANSRSAAKYKIKLSYGIAFLRPSSILYLIQSTTSPHVRRDGAMVRESEIGNDVSKELLDKRYQLLFGTETIYLFLRRYILLCSILEDLGMICKEFGVCENPANSYITSFGQSTKPPEFPLSYKGILTALERTVTKQSDHKSLESVGRIVLKNAVYLVAALPKLIERCTDSLLKAAREDAILYIYDYCQFRGVDPLLVRTRCFAMASDAVYRIQFDNKAKEVSFCFVPKNAELLLKPSSGRNSADDNSDDIEDGMEIDNEHNNIQVNKLYTNGDVMNTSE